MKSRNTREAKLTDTMRVLLYPAGGHLAFFCQAEDGIRGPLWSRGLGEVYKGQTVN